MKKYRLKKEYRKRRVGLVLALALIIAVPVMWACGGGDEKDASRPASGSEASSAVVDSGETAKALAKEIDGMEFNVLVGSKVPLKTAVLAEAPALPKGFKLKAKKAPDFSEAGTREVKVTVKDKAGDTAKAKLNITVIDKDKQEGDYDFITNKGFVGEVRDGVTRVDGIVIVNKSFSVPESYGNGITDEAYAAFLEMQGAAAKKGLDLWIRSEYRSYVDQKVTYDGYVEKEGKEAADRYSARPGYSEHQTGEAMDVNVIDYDFGETKEGAWMNENCAKYGLVIRFPKGKEKESGYKAEPWHIRYVGKDLAPKLYNNGDWLTIEEYFGLDCEYSN